MGKALDLISKLEAKRFDWVSSQESDLGLIAEEVGKIIPEAVWKENGEIKGIRILPIIAIIIESIKELKDGS